MPLKEIHPVSHANERQLVRAVRAGDDRAFEQLFSRYRRRISAYVYGLLNDHGRAEDITQEVFMSALRRLRQTDGPISFKPWIYEIARNACIDEFRRVSRASLVSLEAETEADGPAVRELADHATPEVRWERKQQMGDLFGAFSGLSEGQHKILVLRELEGLSYSEIGSRMGISRPMVESTLFRARRRLTQEYDELASGRRCLEVQAAVDGRDVRALATLGIRERRRIARHLNHCQDCLRHARLAGVDDAALVPGPARRVAALLPFGWLRLHWHRAGAKLSGSGGGSARAAQRASALAERTPQSVAVARGAAAAAALLITGGSISALSHTRHPAPRSAAAVAAPVWSGVSVERALAHVPALVTPRPAAASSTILSRPAARHGGRGAHAQRTRGHGSGHGSGSAGGSAGAPAATAPSAGNAATSHNTAGSPVVGHPPGSGAVAGVLKTLPGSLPLGSGTASGSGTLGGVLAKLPVVGGGSIGLPNPPLPLPTISQPAPTAPGSVSTPSVSVPSVSTPSVSVPGVKTPGVTVPGTSTVKVPSVSVPGVTTPSVSVPGVKIPPVGIKLP